MTSYIKMGQTLKSSHYYSFWIECLRISFRELLVGGALMMMMMVVVVVESMLRGKSFPTISNLKSNDIKSNSYHRKYYYNSKPL